MPRRNELEHKALYVIVNNGNDGVLQSELWRQLDATSREGSRIALKLETKGLILRKKELFEGRWTYRLFPKRKPASLNSIIDAPCLMCPNDPRCGACCTRALPWSLSSTLKSRAVRKRMTLRNVRPSTNGLKQILTKHISESALALKVTLSYTG